MLFHSLPFVCGLSVTLVIYYLIPKKAQWGFLLAASYVFYACADWRSLFFIVLTTVSVYICALRVERLNGIQKDYLAAHKGELSKPMRQEYKKKMRRARRKWMLICVLLNLGVLAVTKYADFFIENIAALFSADARPLNLILPMGISFYTFQSLGYLIDVYRDKQAAQHNPFKFALFVSFFPQLVQGPISRYGDLAPTLFASHRFERKTVSYGLMRMLWGYFKKVVLADRIVTGVITLVSRPDRYTGAYVLVAMLFYAFQLYCDFTGGIDITIGIAETMGIRVTENFNLPYFSKNIKEYWNRWHITMGSWFTDYVFYPVSVSAPMLKLSKWARNHLPKFIGKRVTVYLSCLIVWLATGIWHGAAWNFIVWGLANYAVIMISGELEPLYARFHRRFHLKGKRFYEIFQILRTVLLMSAIRMFDCYRSVPVTFAALSGLFTKFSLTPFTDGSLMELGLSASDYVILGVGFAVVLSVSLIKRRNINVRDRLYAKPFGAFYHVMAVLLIVTLLCGAYGTGYDSSQFIYNQF